MASRNTTTGAVLESIVVPALQSNGYLVKRLQNIGVSFTGSQHIVDLIVQRGEEQEILVSMKWQQSSGTAEEKVPFEIIKLIHAIKHSTNRFARAYIVLGGEGWTKRQFYLSGALREYISDYDLVRPISLEQLITLANLKKL